MWQVSSEVNFARVERIKVAQCTQEWLAHQRLAILK
ncbi:MAG: hypothetical protein ACI8T1_004617, partial [Verrucomicrobiales bacterium]